MRLVIISDTHLQEPELPDGDVLIHCGDLLSGGRVGELKITLPWLDSLRSKFRWKLFVPGNHDRCFEKWPDFCITELEAYDFEVLIDRGVTIDGVKFYGSPWQPVFNNWAFNLPRGEAIREKWSAIPEDTDVLITHGPPQGVLDYVEWDDLNVGCADLRGRVQEVNPRVHCFGHIHGGYGVQKEEHTTFINASICDERYNPTNAPHVIDI